MASSHGYSWGLGVRRTGFCSELCYWPWLLLQPLCLSFSFCEIAITTLTFGCKALWDLRTGIATCANAATKGAGSPSIPVHWHIRRMFVLAGLKPCSIHCAKLFGDYTLLKLALCGVTPHQLVNVYFKVWIWQTKASKGTSYCLSPQWLYSILWATSTSS